MRIGLIIYGTLDILTGGYLYDRMVVEELERQGDEVVLISLPWRNYGRHLTDNFSPTLFQRLYDAQLDVLIQDELNHPSLVLLNRRLKRVVNYPIVSLVHLLRCGDSYPLWQRRLYGWIERVYFNSVDGIICHSHHLHHQIAELVKGNFLSVVAYAGKDHLNATMSLAKIEARLRQFEPLRIIFVGNLIPRKGLHTLLAALTQLPKSAWELTVIGSLEIEPNYVADIHSQIAQAGLTSNIKILGRIPNPEIAPYLARSDLFAMPSNYEGSPIVYIEAMGYGLPVIATTESAAHEIITDGKNGFLVPPEQPDLLAEHIRTLSQNRQQLLQMSLAAYERYQTHPTWAESAAHIRAFLQKLIES